MTINAGQVRDAIGASPAAVSDTKIQAAIEVAYELVKKYVGDAAVPSEVKDRAALIASVEQINQENAPNGVLNQTYDLGTGDIASTPVRIGRDPMKPAYPILDPWVSGRFFCA